MKQGFKYGFAIKYLREDILIGDLLEDQDAAYERNCQLMNVFVLTTKIYLSMASYCHY